MKNKLLFCILGKTASGKDTVSRIVAREMNIPLLVSHTSRPMRTGEQEGINYHFVPDYVFDDMEKHGDFIETTTYHISSENRDYKYGYNKNVINSCEIGMCIVNPHGLYSLLESDEDLNIVAIALERNDKARALSYLTRDDNVNVDEFVDRWIRDRNDFKDLITDYVIFNDTDLDVAVATMKSIIYEEIEDMKYYESLKKELKGE